MDSQNQETSRVTTEAETTKKDTTLQVCVFDVQVEVTWDDFRKKEYILKDISHNSSGITLKMTCLSSTHAAFVLDAKIQVDLVGNAVSVTCKRDNDEVEIGWVKYNYPPCFGLRFADSDKSTPFKVRLRLVVGLHSSSLLGALAFNLDEYQELIECEDGTTPIAADYYKLLFGKSIEKVPLTVEEMRLLISSARRCVTEEFDPLRIIQAMKELDATHVITSSIEGPFMMSITAENVALVRETVKDMFPGLAKLCKEIQACIAFHFH